MRPLHTFGTTRRDIYMRAANFVKANSVVCFLKRPAYGVRHAGKRDVIRGVAVEDARPGNGVWVRVEGPASVRRSDI